MKRDETTPARWFRMTENGPEKTQTAPERYSIATRVRLLAVLFTSAALNRTGFIAVFTVTTLAAEDLLGSVRWSGTATAFGTLGLAVGTTPMAALMARKGRRPGYILGLTIAVGGAALASYGVESASFVVLTAGLFVFGLGSSGDRLGRYAASDIAPVSLRSSAISAIVWAGTVGSVVGPLLLPGASRVAEGFGFSEYVGGFLIGGGMAAAALVVVFIALRPDPLEVAGVTLGAADKSLAIGDTTPTRVRTLLRSPRVQYAIVSMVVGQAVMVLIMTMTPNHIRHAGEGLALIGLVIGVHTFGMFFFAPISGYLADNFGKVPVVVVGQLLLIASAIVAAPAAGNDRTLLLVSMFLLGLGWNFGFVASSSLLTDQATGTARIRLQGVADTAMFATAAVAAIFSGVLLEEFDYAGLSLAGGLLVLVPLLMRYICRSDLVGADRSAGATAQSE